MYLFQVCTYPLVYRTNKSHEGKGKFFSRYDQCLKNVQVKSGSDCPIAAQVRGNGKLGKKSRVGG